MSGSDVTVRLFRRSDRDQLAALVDAHVQAVVPGGAVPVNTLLNRLEAEPGEFIVGPWVRERTTLVAEQRGRVVAAAHLLRYGASPEVGEQYRDTGEIRWLVCWPRAPFWPDAEEAGDAVAAASVAWLTRSGAVRLHADGALPAPGVYGLPEQWPHVHRILRAAGFRPGDRTEDVLLADVADLPRPAPPLPGLTVGRRLGINGTRFTAVLDAAEIGYVEVADLSGDTGRIVRQSGWADIGNLHVAEEHRRRGVATWLLGQAAEWLRLGHVDRLLEYCTPEEVGYRAFLDRIGFRPLTRTTREWERASSPSSGV